MPQQVRLQVFVSSTYEDLIGERQAAVQAILKAGHIPAGMELFAAGDEEQMTVIRRWIDESDIFMLILGGRYGSIESSSGKSYTHLEYEYALERKKPLFSIVMRESSRNLRIQRGETLAMLIEQKAPEKFRNLETLVTSKMCTFAEDIKDIKLGVHESINTLRDRCAGGGWISVRTLPDSSEALDKVAAAMERMNDIEQENQSLRTELEIFKQSNAASKQYAGRTFEENRAVLSAQKVILNMEEEKAETTTLLSLIQRFAQPLAVGVSNGVVKHNEREIFNKVARPLLILGLAEERPSKAPALKTTLALSRDGQRFVGDTLVWKATTAPVE